MNADYIGSTPITSNSPIVKSLESVVDRSARAHLVVAEKGGGILDFSCEYSYNLIAIL